MTETINTIVASDKKEDKKEDNEKGEGKEKEEFILYPNRWLILFIFCLTSMTNSFQVRKTFEILNSSFTTRILNPVP